MRRARSAALFVALSVMLPAIGRAEQRTYPVKGLGDATGLERQLLKIINRSMPTEQKVQRIEALMHRPQGHAPGSAINKWRGNALVQQSFSVRDRWGRTWDVRQVAEGGDIQQSIKQAPQAVHTYVTVASAQGRTKNEYCDGTRRMQYFTANGELSKARVFARDGATTPQYPWQGHLKVRARIQEGRIEKGSRQKLLDEARYR